jgi:5-formyltetrahydrofolate cyclo-ligase
MIDLKTEKSLVRKDIREQLEALPMEQWQQWSDQLTCRLIEMPEYQNASVVMVFLSFGLEYDTEPLIRNAFENGKTVCAPKVDWDARRMEPVRINHPEDIFKDERGLPEPAGSDVVEANQIDLILVPGIAFDHYGRRLGRGGGFYDRFLSRADLRAIRLAPTFDFQVLPELPCDTHDQGVDIVLTPTKKLALIRR